MTILDNGVSLTPIPGELYEYYRAGSDGNIYSRRKYRGGGVCDPVDWYALKAGKQKTGYLNVTISRKGYRKGKSVHRLVCMAYHGMPPSTVHQVRHLDGNKLNNIPTNLKWGTPEENYADKILHGTSLEGERHPMSKLSDKEREHIIWVVSKGLVSQNKVAKALGMSQSAIQRLFK